MPGYRNLDDILTIEQTPLAAQPVPAHTLALLERWYPGEDPIALIDRLWPKFELDPEFEEKLRVST